MARKKPPQGMASVKRMDAEGRSRGPQGKHADDSKLGVGEVCPDATGNGLPRDAPRSAARVTDQELASVEQVESAKEKPYLSPTQVGMYLKCPRQYHYRYVLGKRSPPSGAIAVGSCWHGAVETNYKHKLTHDNEDMPVDDVEAVFSDAWDEAVKDGMSRSRKPKKGEKEIRDEISWVDGEKAGTLKDMGIKVTRLHRLEVAPDVKPKLIEHQFRVNLGDDFPYDLLGYIDLVEEGDVIRDTKSKGRAPPQADVDKDLQLTSYSLARRIETGKVEPHIVLDVVVKKRVPECIQIHTRRTNDQLRWYLRLVEEVAMSIKAGNFPPNPTGWWCSEKWCGYWNPCMKVRA